MIRKNTETNVPDRLGKSVGDCYYFIAEQTCVSWRTRFASVVCQANFLIRKAFGAAQYNVSLQFLKLRKNSHKMSYSQTVNFMVSYNRKQCTATKIHF